MQIESVKTCLNSCIGVVNIIITSGGSYASI
jgi:hypothetical protein